jgi:type 1 glutamine amidotransferase
MLGGWFDGHPWGTFEAPLVVEAPDFPGMSAFPVSFTLRDEIYQIKDFSRDDARVLLRLDARRLDLNRGGIHRHDGDFVVAWARQYGNGRVLYNGLGHPPEIWDRTDFQAMWLDSVRWVLGLVPGDASPSTSPRHPAVLPPSPGSRQEPGVSSPSAPSSQPSASSRAAAAPGGQ